MRLGGAHIQHAVAIARAVVSAQAKRQFFAIVCNGDIALVGDIWVNILQVREVELDARKLGAIWFGVTNAVRREVGVAFNGPLHHQFLRIVFDCIARLIVGPRFGQIESAGSESEHIFSGGIFAGIHREANHICRRSLLHMIPRRFAIVGKRNQRRGGRCDR